MDGARAVGWETKGRLEGECYLGVWDGGFGKSDSSNCLFERMLSRDLLSQTLFNSLSILLSVARRIFIECRKYSHNKFLSRNIPSTDRS
jgi:hypothetical protein